ncbi:hypothetical protein A0K93_03895 [Corynebacterium sp. BCW_4722]|nr:hypothetical protein A0K93_03895 [Corynebacterium sp. BCW_4722]
MSKIDELIQELCPNGVEIVPTGGLAEIGTGKSDRKNAIDGGEYPFYVRSKEVLFIDSYEFDETAIVIPGEGGIGDIFHLATGKYALHQRAYRVHFTDARVNPTFAFYYFQQHFKRFILSKAVSATVTSIRKPMLTEFPLPLPPLEVQEEIVRILDQFVELDRELEQEIAGREKQFQSCRRELLSTLDTQTDWLSLGAAEDSGMVKLGRGKVISKKTIAENPGNYPVYSSSSAGDGEFGRYGEYMFEDERITWSVDGGGKIFYRPAHRYSVTNVSGWLSNLSDDLHTKFLYYVLFNQWENEVFDYTRKAHPSVIRDIYQVPLPPLEVQEEIATKLDTFTEYVDNLKGERELRQKQYEHYRDQLLDFKVKE